MKKFTVIFAIAIAILFIFTSAMVSYTKAEEGCGSNCSKRCEHLGSGPKWAKCIEDCLKECLKYDPPKVPEVPSPTPVKPSGSKSESGSFNFYAEDENQDSYTLDEKESETNHDKLLILAQNQNYVACYKDGEKEPFRWCPTGKPWTATNKQRTLCYVSLEACAQYEMPQSWCIKCGSKD